MLINENHPAVGLGRLSKLFEHCISREVCQTSVLNISLSTSILSSMDRSHFVCVCIVIVLFIRAKLLSLVYVSQ